MSPDRRPTIQSRRNARAFTLLELTVVVAVISILVALSISVGALVIRGGNERATQSVLTSLDRALDEYIASNGAAPPYRPELHIPVFGDQAQTLFEYNDLDQPRRPDAAIFVAQVTGAGVANDIIESIPERFRFSRVRATGGVPATGAVDPVIPSILDAWSDRTWQPPFDAVDERLILYVHPENSLAQDLYGACVNDRPYFLSAGADGLYGLNDDPFVPADGNVHTYESVLEAQADNVTSYEVAPINRRAFNRTDAEGVR